MSHVKYSFPVIITRIEDADGTAYSFYSLFAFAIPEELELTFWYMFEPLEGVGWYRSTRNIESALESSVVWDSIGVYAVRV